MRSILILPSCWNSSCSTLPWLGRDLLSSAPYWSHWFGLVTVVGYMLVFIGLKISGELPSLALHMQHEWITLANLFLLLIGFMRLSVHFKKSSIPDEMPALLPDN